MDSIKFMVFAMHRARVVVDYHIFYRQNFHSLLLSNRQLVIVYKLSTKVFISLTLICISLVHTPSCGGPKIFAFDHITKTFSTQTFNSDHSIPKLTGYFNRIKNKWVVFYSVIKLKDIY